MSEKNIILGFGSPQLACVGVKPAGCTWSGSCLGHSWYIFGIHQRMFVEAVVSTDEHEKVRPIPSALTALGAGGGKACQITQLSLQSNEWFLGSAFVLNPCNCEATPGNTELSNREIIDKDDHPVAENGKMPQVCVRKYMKHILYGSRRINK